MKQRSIKLSKDKEFCISVILANNGLDFQKKDLELYALGLAFAFNFYELK